MLGTKNSTKSFSLHCYQLWHGHTGSIKVALRAKWKEMEVKPQSEMPTAPHKNVSQWCDKCNNSKKNCPSSLILTTGYNSSDKSSLQPVFVLAKTVLNRCLRKNSGVWNTGAVFRKYKQLCHSNPKNTFKLLLFCKAGKH